MTQVLQFPVPPKKEETRYLGLAASNKLIRQVLKAQFPGVKFSVKGDSYAGGSSTDVRWTDGPTQEQVEMLLGGFASAGFDGSIDMQYSYDQWLLPNGLIVTAGTTGTQGSMGYVSSFTTERPEGAVPVRSGIGYLHCRRDELPEFIAAVQKAFSRLSGHDQCELLNRAPRCAWNYDRDDRSPEADAAKVARITPAPQRK